MKWFRRFGFAMVAVLLALSLLSGCSGSAPAAPTAPATPAAPGKMVSVSVTDLQKRLAGGAKGFLVVDVRTPEEWAEGHIQEAKLIPLQTIETGIKGIAKNQEIYLICRSGNRSAQAYQILSQMGYTNLKNVEGGMQDWQKQGFRMVK